MREIKFRAWWSNIGEMEYFDTVAFLNFEDGTLIYQKHPEEETCTDEISDGFELMQYTGLKDKNGKEIYEGDMFEVNCTCYKVVFDNDLAKYCLESKNGLMSLLVTANFEVIGNIYENPELLEEPQNGTK